MKKSRQKTNYRNNRSRKSRDYNESSSDVVYSSKMDSGESESEGMWILMECEFNTP